MQTVQLDHYLEHEWSREQSGGEFGGWEALAKIRLLVRRGLLCIRTSGGGAKGKGCNWGRNRGKEKLRPGKRKLSDPGVKTWERDQHCHL